MKLIGLERKWTKHIMCNGKKGKRSDQFRNETCFCKETCYLLPEKKLLAEWQKGFQALIRSRISGFQLVGQDAEEYPPLPEIEEGHVFKKASGPYWAFFK